MNANIYEEQYVSNFEKANVLSFMKTVTKKIIGTIRSFFECMTAPCPVEKNLEEARQKAREYMTFNSRGIL